MPKVGDLIKYRDEGFDNLPYIDQGVGFIQSIKEHPEKGVRIHVHLFNKIRYRRKNLVEIEIGSCDEEYSLADFNILFKPLENHHEL